MTFVGYGGISVRRQGVQGLHVHVGMPSGDECWRCLDAIVPWLPVVLGLSANSPWFAGELNGMASNRAPILAELPRAGAPPAFASYAEWESWVERLARARRRRGLHAHLVGRRARIRSSGRSRSACPTSRPTSGCRPRSRRSCRRCARPRSRASCPSTGLQLADRGRADYAQNRWSAARFGARRQARAPGRLELRAGGRARRRAARARPARGAASSAATTSSRASTRRAARPTCSSQHGIAATAAAADLVARSLG